MKWLEILHLRSNGDKSLESIHELVKQNLVVDQNSNSQQMDVYRHQVVDSDLCLVLQFESEREITPPSDLGLRLTASLREFGRINHSVWIKM